ncbi:DUF3768 domain-containing protein [Alteriqipengyuania flavescens]|uniref:DUF3768 domain-containing protein n=1 Tax=Alteriqipengyuania flavescens TaxID=3053610 RepID=UPI0025B2F4DF|nr:DUF3768 domain-containing protein [Alteriqipengyuania flavescens]WJY18323.1 DUF3768 domain-containing protein [Alteriqipengyuania flavescens]WJY24264.1 DUF3768 domain-containing protein [Alteriqipengyuania flavescens]
MTNEQDSYVQVPRAEMIAQLNDRLRRDGRGGAIMITKGVRSLSGFCPSELLAKLAEYNGFDEDNDPHGERDFGDLELFGADLLWKIDYYTADMKHGSDDPADPETTVRLLTVMMAEEY